MAEQQYAELAYRAHREHDAAERAAALPPSAAGRIRTSAAYDCALRRGSAQRDPITGKPIAPLDMIHVRDTCWSRSALLDYLLAERDANRRPLWPDTKMPISRADLQLLGIDLDDGGQMMFTTLRAGAAVAALGFASLLALRPFYYYGGYYGRYPRYHNYYDYDYSNRPYRYRPPRSYDHDRPRSPPPRRFEQETRRATGERGAFARREDPFE